MKMLDLQAYKAFKSSKKKASLARAWKKMLQQQAEQGQVAQQIRRAALIVFLMREYQNNSSFMNEGARSASMDRFDREFQENFKNPLKENSGMYASLKAKEGDLLETVYPRLGEELVEASKIYSTVEESNSESVHTVVEALGTLFEHSDLISTCQLESDVIEYLAEKMGSVEWNLENRREILAVILSDAPAPENHELFHKGILQSFERLELKSMESKSYRSFLQEGESLRSFPLERSSSILEFYKK
ncbi:hypothetical protein K2X33_01315 [bacterium]|nr:hypothetical protein [bacterium]